MLYDSELHREGIGTKKSRKKLMSLRREHERCGGEAVDVAHKHYMYEPLYKPFIGHVEDIA